MSPPHPLKPPAKTHSKNVLLSSLVVLLVAFLAVIGFRSRPPIAQIQELDSEYGTIIGIDLGNTYSRVAVQRNGSVEIIPNEHGQRFTPSWVSFAEDGGILIGEAAKLAYHANPKNTLFDVKRFIGRKMDEPGLQEDIKRVPFEIVNKDGKPAFSVHEKGSKRIFTPEQISGMILRKMKENAEAYLGHKVTHAVVSVPAHFTDAQRQATKDAGSFAGLDILRIINDPTVTSVAYGLHKDMGESQVIVYDLGGTTLDVALLSVDDGVFEVLANASDARLGGEEFDNRVMDHLVRAYEKKTGVDVSENLGAMGRLKGEVEKAKRALSNEESTRIEIQLFEGGNRLSEILTRVEFEELSKDLFERSLEPVERVLRDAGVKKEDINEIILVGGSTYIPKIHQLLSSFFPGKQPLTADGAINPDEAVVHGAAIHGGFLSQFREDELCSVPVEITVLSLGLETASGVFTKVVPKFSIIPSRRTKIFSTAVDNQTSILIKIFEGERAFTEDNKRLGTFELGGIAPAPRGVPQIEVTFEVDSDRVVNVYATDMGTGRSESLTIPYDETRYEQDVINRMVEEAERFAGEDEARLAGVLSEERGLIGGAC